MKNADDIIKLMPGRIYWKNRQGIYLGCNDQTLRDYGLKSPQEFIGKNVFDFHQRAIANDIRNIDEEIMSSGLPKLVEENVLFLDGHMGTLLSHKIPLRDEQHVVVGLLGISFDITERKKNEIELKKIKESVEKDLAKTNIYLQNIIANVPGNLYWKNTEGVYLGTNENNAKSAGVSIEEYLGGTVYDLYDNELAQFFDRVDSEVMATGIPKYIEERAPRLDGSPGTFLTQKVPLRDDAGHVIGLLGMSIDITDRKLAEATLQEAKERAESANRAKTQFLATVSHELRTPLTGILGMVQALSYVELPTAAKEYVQDITQSAEHLLSLINDLLDFTKLEAGKMQLNRAPVDLKSLVEQTVHMLAHQARLKNLQLQTFIDPNIPDSVLGDARALRQIILNLMGNALKFTEAGMISIKAQCLEQSALLARIELTVTDTGIGIPQEKLATIFERFTQVDSSYTRRYGGTGLGLSLCKSYLELMGGQINVSSTLNQGSLFTCVIPFAVESGVLLAREIGPQERIDFIPPKKMHLNKVLLVEDNPIVQKVHRMFLEELGYSVEVVNTGKDALAKLNALHNYQLVFLDVGLPDMSGLVVTRLVREYEIKNGTKPVSIIALTAFDQPEDHAHCLNVGMNEVLIKPVDIKHLRNVLARN